MNIKKMNTMLSMVLASLMMILSGCSEQLQTEEISQVNENGKITNITSVKGKYIEEDVTPSDDIEFLTKTPGGTLVAFSTGLISRYDSTDGGKTWAKSDGPGASIESLADASSYDCNITVDEDGNCFIIRSGFDFLTLNKIDSDGNDVDFTLAGFEDITSYIGFSINHISALSDNKLLFWYDSFAEDDTFSSHCALYDSGTGDKIFDISGLDIYYRVSAGADRLCFGDETGNISVRSTENGEEIQKFKMGDEYSEQLTAVTDGGDIYYINNKAISKMDENGSSQKLLDSISFHFGSGIVSDFYTDQDANFIAMLSTDSGYKLYRYYYDADATTDPMKVLTIWTLEESDLLRSIVNQYASSNPDITVEIDVGRDSANAMEDSDIIKNLNTEILAGDGPDLLMLDGLSPENYAGKGILLDLTDLLDTSGVYDEIVSSIKTNEKLYYMPARIKLSLFVSSGEIAAKTTTLEAFVDQVVSGNDLKTSSDDGYSALPVNEQTFASFASYGDVFNLLWNSSSEAFQDASGINTNNLEKFLEYLKIISDKYNLMPSVDISGDSEDNWNSWISSSLGTYSNDRSMTCAFTTGSFGVVNNSCPK